MKNCRNIRGDLSAYLDSELKDSRRAEVSSHLETCAHCRQELSELEKLTAGIAALPKLQPAPRFLTDVRRKIAKGEDPEATTWLEHVFQPFWLKIPLEIAAVVLIVGLIMRAEHPPAIQPMDKQELASASDDNNRQEVAAQATETKAPDGDEAKPPAAERAPAEEAEKQSVQSPAAPASPDTDQKSMAAAESRSVARLDSESKTADSPTFNNKPTESGSQPAVPSQSFVSAVPNNSALSAPTLGLFRTVEPPQSKKAETVTLQSRDFTAVRDRAQQLALRCNGKVTVASGSPGGTEQVLFVEVPREYAAAFKVELSKTTTNGLSAGLPAERSGVTNLVAASQGGEMGAVLTGSVATNLMLGDRAAAGALNEQTVVPPTVLLEIHVVGPAN